MSSSKKASKTAADGKKERSAPKSAPKAVQGTDVAETAATTSTEVAQQSAQEGEKDAASSAAAAQASSALPPFYASAVAFNRERHGDLKFVSPQNYAFARHVHAVVLTAQEFPEAAFHYPIVFGPLGNDLMAFAVLGYEKDRNLFVDEEGQWREGSYIPAYVRRYPFILIEAPDENNMVLGADLKSGLFDRKKGEPLYEEGKPSALALRALNFCMAFHHGVQQTKQVIRDIEEAGILVERRAEVTRPDMEGKTTIAGFQVVDEQRFRQLPDDRFLALRKSGALDLIYAHLLSMHAWKNLLV